MRSGAHKCCPIVSDTVILEPNLVRIVLPEPCTDDACYLPALKELRGHLVEGEATDVELLPARLAARQLTSKVLAQCQELEPDVCASRPPFTDKQRSVDTIACRALMHNHSSRWVSHAKLAHQLQRAQHGCKERTFPASPIVHTTQWYAKCNTALV